jgi:hypothetical protein
MEVVNILLNFWEHENVYFHVMNSRKIKSKKNSFKSQKSKTDYFKYQALIILKNDSLCLYNIG